MKIMWMPNQKSDEIHISGHLSQTIFPQTEFTRKIMLHLGSWKKEVELVIDEDLPINTIGISSDISKLFTIPETLPYEFQAEGSNLHIGPIIAFVACDKLNQLSFDELNKLKDYFTDYQQIGGLIFVCSANSIDIRSKCIKGYYYNPIPGESGSHWNYGTFPYPGAVYRRRPIPGKIVNDLASHTGNRIFNSHFFNKWDLWQAFSPNPFIREHIPDTVKLETYEDLKRMLQKHQSVYLKRASGTLGRGLLKVEKSTSGYHFIDRKNKQIILSNVKDISTFLNNLKRKRGYIIQQAVPLTFQGRKVDFRVIMQKNQIREWKCSGIIARFGKVNNIASNFLRSGFSMIGREALQKIFEMDESDINKMEQEIILTCISACQQMDQTFGHFGDVGIDVVVDPNRRIWILEINKLHMHNIPLYAKQEGQEIYFRTVTTPFKYAKSLAGF